MNEQNRRKYPLKSKLKAEQVRAKNRKNMIKKSNYFCFAKKQKKGAKKITVENGCKKDKHKVFNIKYLNS